MLGEPVLTAGTLVIKILGKQFECDWGWLGLNCFLSYVKYFGAVSLYGQVAQRSIW